MRTRVPAPVYNHSNEIKTLNGIDPDRFMHILTAPVIVISNDFAGLFVTGFCYMIYMNYYGNFFENITSAPFVVNWYRLILYVLTFS